MNKKGLKEKKDNLTPLFKTAIKAIINNYDYILENLKTTDSRQHELINFENFQNLFDESKLEESLEFSASHLRTDQHYYNFWDRIIN